MGRRVVVVATALALLTPASARTTSSGGAEEAFVSVGASELVGVMLDTNRVVARIRLPPGAADVAVSSDRRYLLVTSPDAGAVTLVDAFHGRRLAVVRGLRRPLRAVFSNDRGRAYVSEAGAGTVAELDLPGRRIARHIVVGRDPGSLALSPDGRHLWVTNRRGVAIVDTRSGRVVGHGGAPRAGEVAFDRSGLFVWVTYRESAVIGKVRAYPRTGRLRLQQLVGGRIERLDVDGAGRVWATDPDRGAALRLSRWSGRTLERHGGCAGASDVAVGPGRGRVVVSCRATRELLVWDPAGRTATRVHVGGAPVGVAVALVP